MNRFEKLLGLKGEARLRYLDGEFQVLSPGDFVRCAVTGEPIMLPDLRYWSVELQEAYASAEISFERHRTVKAGPADSPASPRRHQRPARAPCSRAALAIASGGRAVPAACGVALIETILYRPGVALRRFVGRCRTALLGTPLAALRLGDHRLLRRR